MMNAHYFQAHAERLLRLAMQSADKRIAADLVQLAEEFIAMADQLLGGEIGEPAVVRVKH